MQMKKILLFIGLLGILSCKLETSEVNKVKQERIKVETNQYYRYLDVFKFKYEGHTYICINGGRTMNGVVHDPKCLKCKENESTY